MPLLLVFSLVLLLAGRAGLRGRRRRAPAGAEPGRLPAGRPRRGLPGRGGGRTRPHPDPGARPPYPRLDAATRHLAARGRPAQPGHRVSDAQRLPGATGSTGPARRPSASAASSHQLISVYRCTCACGHVRRPPSSISVHCAGGAGEQQRQPVGQRVATASHSACSSATSRYQPTSDRAAAAGRGVTAPRSRTARRRGSPSTARARTASRMPRSTSVSTTSSSDRPLDR